MVKFQCHFICQIIQLHKNIRMHHQKFKTIIGCHGKKNHKLKWRHFFLFVFFLYNLFLLEEEEQQFE